MEWRRGAQSRVRGTGGRRRRMLAGTVVGTTVLLGGWADAAPAHAAGCGLLGLLLPCPPPPPPPPPPPSPPPPPVPSIPLPPVGVNLVGAADQLLQLTNQERARAGVGPLTMRADIVAIAVSHSALMAAQNTLFHNDGYFTSAVRSSLGATALGENVAVSRTIEGAHAALMESPGHRANILDPRFNSVGLAAVASVTGGLYVTEDFAQTRGGPAPVAPRAPAAPARPRPPRPAKVVAAAPTVKPVPTTTPAPAPAPAPPPSPPATVKAAAPELAAAAGTEADGAPVRSGRWAGAAAALLVAVAGGSVWLLARRWSHLL